ncbi:MFS transporter [Pikeienuella sp. HZG-20]|uniref:MFS transporter n=1 Tax=Paludibacillus litoralis TaxID=3133267 RepID=UPI0030ED4D98
MAAHERRIPELLRHAPAPGVKGFAFLASIEAAARGIMVSVYPLAMYQALGDAETVSEAYFFIGVAALLASLVVPALTRLISRRWTFTVGALLLAAGALTASRGGPLMTPLGLGMTNAGVVCVFICFNAYVMDYIDRANLGESETLRLFYSGLAWTVGPILGVWLMTLWPPAPFYIAATAALVLLGVFWWMRLGDGKLIVAARRRTASPLRYLPRFLAQPRLIAGWFFAVIRSVGWWAYVVYMPIYAVEAGYAKEVGAGFVSMANACLFLTPFMLRWMRRRSVRAAVRTGFLGAALCFLAASLAAYQAPPATIALLAMGAFFLVLLDVSGGLPFLMAVRPHERTEMAVIYSSFRDVSGIVTPGAVRLVLAVAPLAAVFATAAAALFIAWSVAGRLHPRLGVSPREGLQPEAKPSNVRAGI